MCLDSDGIKLSSQTYYDIINEIEKKKNLPHFNALSYLLTHPDDKIRNLALSLSTDKEISLAVNEEAITSNLQDNADKLISDLEIAILEDKINSSYQLIHSKTLSDEDIVVKLQEIQDYKQAQALLKRAR